MDELLNYDFSEALEVISEIIRDPASNITVALLLLGLVTILLVIVFLAVMLIVSSATDEEDEDVLAEGVSSHEHVAESSTSDETINELDQPRRSFAGFVRLVAAIIGAVSIAWIAGGVLTQQNSVCVSCHVEHPHADVVEIDPHVEVPCVSCHEPAGKVGSVTYMLPDRVVHFVSGARGSQLARVYGKGISSRECARCHRDAIQSTLTNESRGVRVSHVEPLEAGAECVDCHQLNTGVVSSLTIGMSPCLRCHDGNTASNDCQSCHTKDVGAAARPSALASERRARDLVGQPDCGGCHNQTTCDACHGIRMPHSEDFMQLGHARAYAENRWFGDGQQCTPCHNSTRRPCTRCHDAPFPQHPIGLAEDHKSADPSGGGCDGCHNPPFMVGRNFCSDICHRPGQDQ